MRTIRTKIYSFEGLSKESKENAIKEIINKGIDTDYIYDDAHNTVKAFNELFNVKEGLNSWLDYNLNNIEEDIINLKGLRLQKYIYNNFSFKLFKGKYFGSLKTNKVVYHARIKSKKLSNGNVFNPYYSGIIKENCCVLTGVCYDDDMLKPIYDFLNLRVFDNTNFADLINECFYSLKNSIEKEIDYLHTNESIIDTIIDNNYEFLSNGKQY